jgi:hypothetical protein
MESDYFNEIWSAQRTLYKQMSLQFQDHEDTLTIVCIQEDRQ